MPAQRPTRRSTEPDEPEQTDPHYRPVPPPAVDYGPTIPYGDDTRQSSGNQVSLGHQVAQGETLIAIRDHCKRSADADQEFIAIVKAFVAWVRKVWTVASWILAIGGFVIGTTGVSAFVGGVVYVLFHFKLLGIG